MRNRAYWSWEYAIAIAGSVLTGGLLITLLTSCATPYVPVVVIPTSKAQGWTVCDQKGNPAIVYYNSVPPDYERFLLLHEWVHVSQVRRDGDCRRFLRKYAASELVRMESEAEAECVVVALAIIEGYPVDTRALWEYFAQSYPNTSEEERAQALSCVP